jgi:hypothetical protein
MLVTRSTTMASALASCGRTGFTISISVLDTNMVRNRSTNLRSSAFCSMRIISACKEGLHKTRLRAVGSMPRCSNVALKCPQAAFSRGVPPTSPLADSTIPRPAGVSSPSGSQAALPQPLVQCVSGGAAVLCEARSPAGARGRAPEVALHKRAPGIPISRTRPAVGGAQHSWNGCAHAMLGVDICSAHLARGRAPGEAAAPPGPPGAGQPSQEGVW